MIAIDDGTLSDLPVLTELLGMLFANEAEFERNAAKQSAGLKLILDDPGVGHVLVARSDGYVAGMINLLFTVSTALGRRVAILDDLIISRTFRGRGVGKLLMDAAIRYCTEHGYGRITLQTDLDNLIAQHLYESRGFVRSGMITYKKIL
jgi:ribosomal protein S18 acetylase RimI-like enzyme